MRRARDFRRSQLSFELLAQCLIARSAREDRASEAAASLSLADEERVCSSFVQDSGARSWALESSRRRRHSQRKSASARFSSVRRARFPTLAAEFRAARAVFDCSLRSRGSRCEAAAFLSHSQTKSVSARSFVQDSGARSWRWNPAAVVVTAEERAPLLASPPCGGRAISDARSWSRHHDPGLTVRMCRLRVAITSSLTAVLKIAREHVEAMIAHAREDHPDEACGVIVGPEGSDVPTRLVRMINADRSPTFSASTPRSSSFCTKR